MDSRLRSVGTFVICDQRSAYLMSSNGSLRLSANSQETPTFDVVFSSKSWDATHFSGHQGFLAGRKRSGRLEAVGYSSTPRFTRCLLRSGF